MHACMYSFNEGRHRKKAGIDLVKTLEIKVDVNNRMHASLESSQSLLSNTCLNIFI